MKQKGNKIDTRKSFRHSVTENAYEEIWPFCCSLSLTQRHIAFLMNVKISLKEWGIVQLEKIYNSYFPQLFFSSSSFTVLHNCVFFRGLFTSLTPFVYATDVQTFFCCFSSFFSVFFKVISTNMIKRCVSWSNRRNNLTDFFPSPIIIQRV